MRNRGINMETTLSFVWVRKKEKDAQCALVAFWVKFAGTKNEGLQFLTWKAHFFLHLLWKKLVDRYCGLPKTKVKESFCISSRLEICILKIEIKNFTFYIFQPLQHPSGSLVTYIKLSFSHMTKKTLIHKLEHVAFQTEQASGFLLLDFYFDMLWNFHEKANLQFSEVS